MVAEAMPRVLSMVYDAVTEAEERRRLRAIRRELLQDAAGRVLEVGAGTGRNLEFYDGDRVEELILAEPDKHMLSRLEAKLGRVQRRGDWRVVRAPIGELCSVIPEPDTIVCTLVLCSVPDLSASVAALWRLLAPGGRLLFIEHERAADGTRTQAWQRRLEPSWRKLAGNCHLTRQATRALAAAGFSLGKIETEVSTGLGRLFSPILWGIASKPASEQSDTEMECAQ